jgi:hypothetical protein
VAVGAVRCKPVSARFSLINRDLQGKFPILVKFQDFHRRSGSKIKALRQFSLQMGTAYFFGGTGNATWVSGNILFLKVSVAGMHTCPLGNDCDLLRGRVHAKEK